jgi:nucleoside-diphosphate-sugar epimerase
MKILITGGTGFIGSHVVDCALMNGHEVTLFDRLMKGTDHYRPAGTNLICGDIRDREAVQEAVYKHDAVINLAGILGTMETVDNPHPSVDTNIHGALNIFEACRPNSMLKGGVRGVQITVGNHFMNNTYAITKSTAERFALMFNKEFKTRIVVIRGLNAYGPGQKHKPVRKITPNFVLRALKGMPIEVYGDGSQIMDMIYVEDLARILLMAATCIPDGFPFDRILEAGTGRRTTVLQIANLVNRLTGNLAGVKHLPMRPGEIEGSVVLGNPNTLYPLGPISLMTLEEGLEKTIQWYRTEYKEAL